MGWALFGAGPLLANLEWVAPMTGITLFAVGAMVGFIAAVMAGVLAWRRKERRLAIYGALGMLPTAVLVIVMVTAPDVPTINDITTDTEDPPQFVTAAKDPELQDADLDYPDAFGPIVEEHYGHLEPLIVAQPRDAVAGIVAEVARAELYEVSAITEDGAHIEGVDVSGIFRFRDDVVIRLRDTAEGGTRIDIRSRSRVGKGDMGVNAARIERLLKALDAKTSP